VTLLFLEELVLQALKERLCAAAEMVDMPKE
jgi:hypothetical protein